MAKRQVRFLSVEDLLQIHADTIAREGGPAGLREPGLLESAVMMPQQRFGARLLHPTLGAMAAAYLFHLAQNHPFLDGNKRTAAMAALVFLDVNGVAVLPEPDDLEAMTVRVASGDATKVELTEWMERTVEG